MRSIMIACLFAAGLSGCAKLGAGSNSTLDASTSGDGGTAGIGTGGDNDGDGGVVGEVDGFIDPCSDQAKLVYAVESNTAGTTHNLYSFRPQNVGTATDPFTLIGPLTCSATARPFSMAIDRAANAYVLYDDGTLYKVSTTDAHCDPIAAWNASQMVGGTTFKLFGMGFAANAPSSTDETLFIGGGPSVGGTSSLGNINMQTFAITRIADFNSQWPEMSGTGDAKLWAFIPQTTATNVDAKIIEVNKTSGAALQTITSTGMYAIPQGQAEAWAFAVWGGEFWVFLKRQSGDTSTNVYHVKKDGSTVMGITNSGKRIVGAGVSTCAPTFIP